MPGRWTQPDHSQGDANTIGGYTRVHGRPAAFEGPDGLSYSVALEVDATGDTERPYGAYFLFLRWRRVGAQGVDGHLETDYLAHGRTADEVIATLGARPLGEVRAVLFALVAELSGGGEGVAGRRWWDATLDEG